MFFTPFLPVGVGLVASGAGVGISTAAADAIGQHLQKGVMKKGLQHLTECENRALVLLETLSEACFSEIDAEDWTDARGAGISFDAIRPEEVGNTLLTIGGATSRTAAGVASRIGLDLTTKSLSVLGALVSSGDFIFSLLTVSPNRDSLARVLVFIESKCEAYHVWMVLLEHWLSLCAECENMSGSRPGTPTPDTDEHSVHSGASVLATTSDSQRVSRSGENDMETMANFATAPGSGEQADEAISHQYSSDEILRRAMMEAVASPFTHRSLSQEV